MSHNIPYNINNIYFKYCTEIKASLVTKMLNHLRIWKENTIQIPFWNVLYLIFIWTIKPFVHLKSKSGQRGLDGVLVVIFWVGHWKFSFDNCSTNKIIWEKKQKWYIWIKRNITNCDFKGLNSAWLCKGPFVTTFWSLKSILTSVNFKVFAFNARSLRSLFSLIANKCFQVILFSFEY